MGKMLGLGKVESYWLVKKNYFKDVYKRQMQNSTNMRILELLRFLYERTDENHPATVSAVSYTHLDVYKRQ